MAGGDDDLLEASREQALPILGFGARRCQGIVSSFIYLLLLLFISTSHNPAQHHNAHPCTPYMHPPHPILCTIFTSPFIHPCIHTTPRHPTGHKTIAIPMQHIHPQSTTVRPTTKKTTPDVFCGPHVWSNNPPDNAVVVYSLDERPVYRPGLCIPDSTVGAPSRASERRDTSS